MVVRDVGPPLVVVVGLASDRDAVVGPQHAQRVVPPGGDNPLAIGQQQVQPRAGIALADVGGEVLVVSQFTLYGDTRGGRRPSYIQAATPEDANRLYEEFVRCLRSFDVQVETGVFQAQMEVELVNDGPVTILLDSEKTI